MEAYLRRVTEQDRDLLFQWANDEDVRKSSFSSGKISYEEHCEWFDKMMKNEQCIQWILEANNQPVGQIRINIDGENAEIGYSVCRERRGEGFGKLMLNLAMQYIQENLPIIKKMVARVKPENIASKKAFVNNGYKVIFEQLELNLRRMER